jgi:undecaprenyl-diphosphatase
MVALGTPWMGQLDESLRDATRSWADQLQWPVDLARIVGTLTQPVAAGVALAVLALWLLGTGLRAGAGFLLLSGILGAVLTTATKVIIQRERPAAAQGLVVDMNASYPSGHASAGIYLFLAGGLALLNVGRVNGRAGLARTGVALIVVGPLIGVSRLVLGVHWASDVIGGWAFGSTALLVASLLLWARLHGSWGLPATRRGQDGSRGDPASPGD